MYKNGEINKIINADVSNNLISKRNAQLRIMKMIQELSNDYLKIQEEIDKLKKDGKILCG